MLERLAALDSQAPLHGEVLIAEVDGDPVAALSLGSGRLVADPFVHTAAVCDLLRFRPTSIAVSRSEASSLKRLFRLVPAQPVAPVATSASLVGAEPTPALLFARVGRRYRACSLEKAVVELERVRSNPV